MLKVYGEFNIDSQEFEIIIKKGEEASSILPLPYKLTSNFEVFYKWVSDLERTLNALN